MASCARRSRRKSPTKAASASWSLSSITPKIGIYNYRVFVPPLPGEKNKDDNEYALTVEVVDARNRLLYVEGIPRWEYKFLRRTLLAGAADLAGHLLHRPGWRPARRHAGGQCHRRHDAAAARLFQDRHARQSSTPRNSASSARNNLAKFVEDGGSLVLLGGTKAWGPGGLVDTELGKTLPVRGAAVKTARKRKALSRPAQRGRARPSRLRRRRRALADHPARALGLLRLHALARRGDAGHRRDAAGAAAGGRHAALRAGQSHRHSHRFALALAARPRGRQGQALRALLDAVASRGCSRARKPGDKLRLELFADRDQLYLGESLELHARLGAENRPSRTPWKPASRCPTAAKSRIAWRRSSSPRLPAKPSPASRLPFAGRSAPVSTKSSRRAKIERRTRHRRAVHLFRETLLARDRPASRARSISCKPSPKRAAAFFRNLDALNDGLSALKLKATEEKSAEYRTLWREWPVVVGLMTMLAASWGMRKFRNMP